LHELSGYEVKGAEKYFTPKAAGYLSACLAAIRKEEKFDESTLEGVYEKLTQELGVKLGELVHPSRLALTGKTVSPGLFDVMVLLGREKTLQRLQAAVEYIGEKS
jgi:glutamyl-tRNA synthetase